MILAIALSVVSGGAIGQGLLTGDRSLLAAASLALVAGVLLTLSSALAARRRARGIPLSSAAAPSLETGSLPRLGELVLREGLVERAGLEKALARQRVTGQRLEVILVEMGLVRESDLRRVLGAPQAPWFE
jgi:hypothetical protein